jgi:hypothetical protein
MCIAMQQLGMCAGNTCVCQDLGLDGGLPDGFDFDADIPDGFDFDGGLPDGFP